MEEIRLLFREDDEGLAAQLPDPLPPALGAALRRAEACIPAIPVYPGLRLCTRQELEAWLGPATYPPRRRAVFSYAVPLKTDGRTLRIPPALAGAGGFRTGDLVLRLCSGGELLLLPFPASGDADGGKANP
jgi:hypothetical protein